MASFLEELAAKAGLQGDQAHHGIGALLTLLKDRLDSGDFARLQQSVPDASEALSKFEAKIKESKGGLLDAIKDVAGKLVGGNAGDASAALQSRFGSAGLSPEHLKNFLPALSEMLANKLPPDVMNKIREHLPAFSHSVEEAASPSSTA